MGYIIQFLLAAIMTSCRKICTYNSQGLGDGRFDQIDKLVNSNDFTLVQEHWLMKPQLNLFEKKIRDIQVHGCSAMDESILHVGRPFGGCAILWKNSLTYPITPIDTKSSRMCAVSIKFESYNILLFNVYMPCDTIYNYHNLAEYQSVLDEVSQLCIEYNADTFVIAGDFNTDMSRQNSLHTNALQTYLTNECCKSCLDCRDSSINYTFESKINGSRSTLDHCIVSEDLFHQVLQYSVRHEGDNLSDHSPVELVLAIPMLHTPVEAIMSSQKLKWCKATNDNIADYKHKLDGYLEGISIPLDAIECTNYTCKLHNEKLQQFHDQIIIACVNASKECIPSSQWKENKEIPGWNEFVKEHRERAIFWHNIWKDSGSPREGVVADIRRRCRAKYHYALRYVRKNKEHIKATYMAQSLLDNDESTFWAEVRKIRGSRTPMVNNVDGVVGKENIGKLFAGKANDLYNTVSYDEKDMLKLLDTMETNVTEQCSKGHCYHSHSVTVSDVHDAVQCLKTGKSDGNNEQTTDHLIYGSNKLNIYLSLLFSSMINHGCSPNEFLLSTIIPIPKSRRKSSCDSENYRGIALSSVLCKLIDHVILKSNRNIFQTSDMQFGFKPKHSTTQCTFVLNEVIQYYLNGGSDVYSILLDASKAFDRVHYVKLFRLLLDRGICPTIARFLAIMYTSQRIRIKWGDFYSDTHAVSNGVK
jgi:hypothetical protein